MADPVPTPAMPNYFKKQRFSSSFHQTKKEIQMPNTHQALKETPLSADKKQTNT
jgi:tRNA(Glu) U13 pseudouridine synthase TruD